MTTLQTHTRQYNGYTATISVHRDEDMGPPWEEHDGHGIVADWERRDKRPGEMVLCQDRNAKRFYDYQATLEIAKRDGWGCGVHPGGETCKCGQQHLTERECIACAVMQDFKYLRGWCNDEWQWLGYTTTITTPEGKTIDGDSCWGFEEGKYMLEEATSNAWHTIDTHIATTEQTAMAECYP